MSDEQLRYFADTQFGLVFPKDANRSTMLTKIMNEAIVIDDSNPPWD